MLTNLVRTVVARSRSVGCGWIEMAVSSVQGRQRLYEVTCLHRCGPFIGGGARYRPVPMMGRLCVTVMVIASAQRQDVGFECELWLYHMHSII